MQDRSAGSPAAPELIRLDRNICTNLPAAESREWLVTNGLGGFAMGTVAGLLTRRYHGLLVAALEPPARRTLLVAKLDEVARVGAASFALGANRWSSGAIDPHGFQFIESFALEGTTPVWTYALGGARLEKRVWMQQGANTTYVEYRLDGDTGSSVELELKALVDYRDFHSATHAGNWRMQVEPVAHGVRVTAYEGAVPYYLLSSAAAAEIANEWYYKFELAAERERGLDDCEDHLHAATFRVTLQTGQSASLIFTTNEKVNLDAAAAQTAERTRTRYLHYAMHGHATRQIPAQPEWISQLGLAASQFVVEVPAESADSPGVIAGYPWFGVWSRDTMISLAGLTLATGRPEIARGILRRFGGQVNGGMLPNYFPERGEAPQYNSVDAALWYVEAVRQYHDATGDLDLVRELFPALAEIARAYASGTRFSIHADPADGLLYAGEAGTNLTWMDARSDGRAVTPRVGKPVEVNALWINALENLAAFARKLGTRDGDYAQQASRARNSFTRFWNSERGYCFDVLDGPKGNEAELRPNQIFAVSLRTTLLSASQRFAIVEACEQHLLTPFGLRTLAADAPGYCARYTGAESQRAAAYHQGTVWPWLLGPFALAYFRVHRDRAATLRLFDAIAGHLNEAGLGSVGEVHDAEPPFTARGCPAQAWSVAEMLHVWTTISESAAR